MTKCFFLIHVFFYLGNEEILRQKAKYKNWKKYSILFWIFRNLDFLVLGIKDWEFQHSFIFLPKYPGIFSLGCIFLQYLEHSTMYGSENGRISQQFTPKNAHKRSNEESSTGASCWPIFYGHKRIVSRVLLLSISKLNNFVSKVHIGIQNIVVLFPFKRYKWVQF